MILSNGLAVCLSFTLLAGYLRNKLATDSTINSLALFGIFAGWFYFASAVIAPVTIGWGRLVSACSRSPLSNAMQRLRRSLASSVFARETTLIFALVMFLALLLAGEGRGRGVVASVLMLAASCLLYLALRIGLTSGYAHQIDPDHILAQFALLRFPAHFFIQAIAAQGMLVLLLVLIAARHPREATHLFAAAMAVSVVALATDVTDVGVLLGETLPIYAVIFMLA